MVIYDDSKTGNVFANLIMYNYITALQSTGDEYTRKVNICRGRRPRRPAEFQLRSAVSVMPRATVPGRPYIHTLFTLFNTCDWKSPLQMTFLCWLENPRDARCASPTASGQVYWRILCRNNKALQIKFTCGALLASVICNSHGTLVYATNYFS